MPFHDTSWEDLQRDCTIFPAYTDYIYGPDARPEVVEEPGLHPLLYPPRSEPIRYTNSMPSRSWPYTTAQTFVQPVGVSMTIEKAAPEDELSTGTSHDYTSCIDLRPSLGSPLGQLIPPESVHAIPLSEMPRNRILNRSPDLPITAVPNSSQHRLRGYQQQTQVQGQPILSSTSRNRAPSPHLLRSSSATDIDERVANMVTTSVSMLSSSTSPPPMDPFPAQLHQSQSNHIPRPIPLIQPGELINDPHFAYISRGNRQRLNDRITMRWNVVHSHPDLLVRNSAMNRIRSISDFLFFQGRGYEQDRKKNAEMQKQLEAEYAQAHMQYDGISKSTYLPYSAPRTEQELRSLLSELLSTPPDPSLPKQLRTDIDHNIPRLLECLQIVNSADLLSRSPETAEESEDAHSFLAMFKATLPPEGIQYIQEVVTRMFRETGTFPLADFGGW